MKNKYKLLFILFLAFSAFKFYDYSKSQDLDNQIRTKAKNRIFSQKKSYVKGKIKKDSPNEFAKYFEAIKKEIGKESDDYPSNYLFKELKKAEKTLAFSKKLDAVWTSRGPGNVGGRSRGIIIDPDDPTANTWFIAAVGGGVWKTTDAGKSWTELTTEQGSLSASYMAMAPSNHNVIYLGTGEGFGNLDALGGQGIWKSTDKGTTWVQLESSAKKEFGVINRIIVDPNNENILLAATSIGNNNHDADASSGIWKSTDGGATWVKKYSSSKVEYSVQQIITDPTNFSIMFASENGNGILKSTDAGETWTRKAELKNGRIELAISSKDPDRLYASAEGPFGEPSELYVSRDRGDSWVKCRGGIDFLGGQGWYDNAIIVDPFDENTLFVAGVNIYRVKCKIGNNLEVTTLTDNYGNDPSLRKGTHVDNHFFAIAKLDEQKKKYRLVGTNDGGVCYTDDKGETFKQPISGFVTSQFYGVDKANGKERYIGGMQDNSCFVSPMSPNVSSDWTFAFGGDGFDVVWNYEDTNKVMLTSQSNNIAVTHKGISSIVNNVGSDYWIADVEKGRSNAPFYTRLSQSKQYPDLVFTYGKKGIWRTDNFGESWATISMPADFGYDASRKGFRPTIVKISLADPSIVWAGSSVHSTVNMYVSKDFGLTYNKTNSSNLVMSHVSGFATHPKDKNTAYALFSSFGNAKILRTTDLGKTWEDISGFKGNNVSDNNFPDVAVFDLLVMPYNTDIIWVGTEIGIIESVDNGVSWHMLNADISPVSVFDMIIVNDKVVIGTHGRGVWTVTLPEEYNPPLVKLPAKLEVSYLFRDSKQNADIKITNRDNYESVKVYINDELRKEYKNVKKGDVEKLVTEIKSGENSIKLVSKIGDRELESLEMIKGLPLKKPSVLFVSDFNSLSSITDEFHGDGFDISKPSGFDSKAINTDHPYSEDTDYVLYLNTPIIVNKDEPLVSYKDVAIVEPGDPGSVYPRGDFWDYVTIQGSTDGINWVNMVTPYDARFDSGWLSKYNSSSNPSKSNFVNHSFNTTDFFNDGDVILLRFNLYSDAEATGWGWIIDDLQIQKDALSLEDNYLSTTFKVYPNPVVDNDLYLESTTDSRIENVRIFDLTGKLLLNVGFDKEEKAKLNVSSFAKGQYLLKVETDKGAFSKKVLIK